jgi:hypothetical protein
VQDQCFWEICFFRLTGQEPKFFGFSEYLAALALMVLAWTIADVRYRFRIQTAPLPVRGLTFTVIASVGFLTLATDLWRAERWYVPRGDLISPAGWQALLGSLLLITFLMWAWFAFIRPQTFGRWNALRYTRAVYRTILKGDPNEIAVVADELAYSAKALIQEAPLLRFGKQDEATEYTALQQYAEDILLLLGDRRFCRAVVSSSPGTILAIFSALEQTKKHRVALQPFARNLISEAIMNRDSFIYHEEEGYRSGLMGYYKPLSHAIFSNYSIVEGLEYLLDPDVPQSQKWEAAHWEAYGRLTNLTLAAYVKGAGLHHHSYVLHRAFHSIARSCMDLYQLNGTDNSGFDDDRRARLRIAVEAIKKAVEILNEADHTSVRRRIRERYGWQRSILDLIAECIVELIKEASAVKAPRSLNWFIQHNYLWGELFNYHHMPGSAAEKIKFKVRRALYDEIRTLDRMTNYQSAAVLGFLLNVMGVNSGQRDGHDRDTHALHVVVLRWTKRNFMKLHTEKPSLAEASLVEGLELDVANLRLARAYGLNPKEKPRYAYLDLDPVPANAAEVETA